MPDDEPVKLYGIFPVGYRRYVVQSIVEGLGLVAVLVAWYVGWPALAKRLAVAELPPAMVAVREILRNVPWLVLGLAIFKAVELYVMLPAFRRKAATPSAPGNPRDGQAPLSPLPGARPAGEEARP